MRAAGYLDSTSRSGGSWGEVTSCVLGVCFYNELREPVGNLVAHAPEYVSSSLVWGSGRVFKTPVQKRTRCRKSRARFFGSIANGDHVVEFLSEELSYIFGATAGNVYSQFSHGLYGRWIQARRMRTSTCAFKVWAADERKQRLSHLAPRGITGTEEQHPCFHRYCSDSNHPRVALQT